MLQCNDKRWALRGWAGHDDIYFQLRFSLPFGQKTKTPFSTKNFSYLVRVCFFGHFWFRFWETQVFHCKSSQDKHKFCSIWSKHYIKQRAPSSLIHCKWAMSLQKGKHNVGKLSNDWVLIQSKNLKPEKKQTCPVQLNKYLIWCSE